MALPTKDKTWQYLVNTAVYTATANLWYDIKNTLCTFGSAPWTVALSCNNTSFGAADYWNSPSDVKWNSSSGQIDSWIVLQQAGINGTFQWLIVTYTNTTYTVRGGMEYYISPSAGFTGGSTSSRPTATDEVNLPPDDTYNIRTIYPWTNTTGQGALRLQIWMSDDGECTRIAMYRSGTLYRMLMFEKPKNPISGWTNPHVAINSNHNGDSLTYADMKNGNGFTSILNPTGGRAAVYLSGEGVTSVLIPENQTWVSDFDSSYPLCPVGLYSTTAGARGRLGELYDCYWGSSGLANGSHYPDDATRLWVQNRDLVMPWNGGAAMLTS